MSLNYSYDPTGFALGNLVQDELKVIVAPTADQLYTYDVPDAAPFFGTSVNIYTQPKQGGVKLVEGQDYELALIFSAGKENLGQMIYGAIIWLNSNYVGNVYITYQTLGGTFAINDTMVLRQVLAAQYRDIRTVTFDQIAGVPSAFPPNSHTHDVEEVKDFQDVVAALSQIASALIAQVGQSGSGSDSGALGIIIQHLQNNTNAHSKAAVGLGNVSNYSVASVDELSSSRNDRYVTPLHVYYLYGRLIAAERLDDIRTALDTITNQASTTTQNITSIKLTVQNYAKQIQDLSAQIDGFNKNVTTLTAAIQNLQNQFISTNASAQQANAQAAATDKNMQQIVKFFNGVVYAGTKTYPRGSHRIVLAAANNVSITAVGAGGGSGAYYNSLNDLLFNQTALTDGEDTIIYACGTTSNPIEPFPIMIAGGGKAGTNNLLDHGTAKGGKAGQSVSAATRLNTSVIKNMSYNSVSPGDATTIGTVGVDGLSNATERDQAGVGGKTINATGNLSSLTYGKGRAGTTRAGSGGSGGNISMIVANDLNEDYVLVAVVGKAGQSSRGLYTPTENVHESNGVIYTTLVN